MLFQEKVVIEKLADLTAKTNTPAGTYYKQVGAKLILGTWDGKNTFTPNDPPQIIDTSKSFPISLPYACCRQALKLRVENIKTGREILSKKHLIQKLELFKLK